MLVGCRDRAQGFECFGRASPCPEVSTEAQKVPEHARVLYSNPGRAFLEQRMWSISRANGTARPQINKPHAQVVCEEGYQGIPDSGQYQITLSCQCNINPFGTTCYWNNFDAAMASVVEVAGPLYRAEWRVCKKAGCTDPSALHFDHSALVDDGSCIEKIPGCMDPSAKNYLPYANVNASANCRYEVDGDECDSRPCVHGSCRDLFNNFRCICEYGWSGVRCDSQSAPPAPPTNQCQHGYYRMHDKCNPCTVCPNGKAEHTPCTATSNTYCETCPSGRFNDGSWAEGGCHDCSACCRGWLLQHDGGCRPDRDTQCVQCPQGQYGGGPGQCLSCDSCANADEVCVHSAHANCRTTETLSQQPMCTAQSQCLHGGVVNQPSCVNLFGTVVECQVRPTSLRAAATCNSLRNCVS